MKCRKTQKNAEKMPYQSINFIVNFVTIHTSKNSNYLTHLKTKNIKINNTLEGNFYGIKNAQKNADIKLFFLVIVVKLLRAIVVCGNIKKM